MDFLILTPPVLPPSEPPSGAFMLAAALNGHGYKTAVFDLSLEFYYDHFASSNNSINVERALKYLKNSPEGYDPVLHRSHSGTINNDLKRFSKLHMGWRLSAMDISLPGSIHSINKIEHYLSIDDPFLSLWKKHLQITIEQNRPKKIIVSVSYLSQLAAAVSLKKYLDSIGQNSIFGGSLFRSLDATGKGLNFISAFFTDINLSNGSTLISTSENHNFLHKLIYPQIISAYDYISTKPVLPLTLSTGCYWSKCLFCPDREMKFIQIPVLSIDNFLNTIPDKIKKKEPVIHLLDSAMPPKRLKEFLPVAKEHKIKFYGFARPEKALSQNNLLTDAAQSGCAMLQLGVENANMKLLNTFDKGIDPKEAQKILNTASDAGIRTYAYMLFGLPGETALHRTETFNYLKNNASAIDFLNLSIFNLPTYSELTQRAAEFNIEPDDYTTEPDAITLYKPFKYKGTNIRYDARIFISSKLKTSPRIKKILNQTPKWFRAAHLSMMNLPNRNQS